MFKKIINKFQSSEIIILIIFVLIFILIRSIHFSSYLNFSLDQATFSLKSLEIFTNKTVTLIGPSLSLNLNGRHIFQGPFTYYFQLIFLIIGRFDPIMASYSFMIFCSIMIIPLYFGVKLLINKNCALTMIIIYSLFPIFINYTRFLWSPNYQLSLIPGLIYIMGLLKTKQTKIYFLAISIYSAILIQIHYLFLPISIGIFVFYLFKTKRKIYYSFVFIIGHMVGLAPIILFEARNNFYNLRTAVLFLQNFDEVLKSSRSVSSHYFLAFSLFFFIIILSLLKQLISFKFNILLCLFLLTISLSIYSSKPANAFGMAKDWNYLGEKKVYDIIRSENLQNYNIVNLIYDTKANVQVYLHAKNSVKIENENYESNKYLFVMTSGTNYMNDGAYEVNRFKPSSEIKKWTINNIYTLYLLKREN